MERQNTGWGHIDWLEDYKGNSENAMRVGVVTIDPHAHMPAHIHFDEQIIYTFQGNGYSMINGERINMSSEENSLLHWQPGVIHEMFNTGEEPYVHLMVTCSDQLTVEGMPGLKEKNKITMQEGISSLYEAIDAVKDQFLDSLRYSFVIYDILGNVAATSRLFPGYCRDYCKESIKTGAAPCMRKKDYPIGEQEGSFECPAGLTVLYVPIVFMGIMIGHVEGGYLYTKMLGENGEKNNLPKLYFAPFSSVESVQIMLKRIVKVIQNFCDFNWYKNDLKKQEQRLAKERKDKELLQADLKNVESSIIDLKINNHFLFNTLNHMAAMALDTGVMSLYQSIVDLSKLFQYTLKHDSNIVTLDQELDYLRSYLKLQKLRYGDNLEIQYAIHVDTKKWRVPFNWLMPLAENAFTHGFRSMEIKRLWVTAIEEDGWLEATIRNNGVCLEESACRALRIRMRSNTTHGMPMVYQKLKASYGDQFIMDITSNEKGTKISILLPYREENQI